ncbi:MAG: CBS domain-containing protein [Candidatus Buchananbacteria bacterium]
MKIRQVMYKKIYTISQEKTLRQAMALMIKKQASGLVVIDSQDKLLGIISEKDIYKSFYPSYNDFYESPTIFTDYEAQEKDIKYKLDKTVGEIMTKDVISVSPDDYVMKVGAIMMAKNIHRIPVVLDDKLIGVVTRGCIYKTLFKKYLKLK